MAGTDLYITFKQETYFSDGLQVFGPEHNGSHIYKHSGIADVVQSAMKGVNGTVLAYGRF